MILIVGGRWQGKLDFAREQFGFAEDDIFLCDADAEGIDFGRRCVAYIDRWALGCVRRGQDPVQALEMNLDRLRDAVVILTDVTCGVVPVQADLRAWRDACGRMGQMLSARSDAVWRLFCGLPQRIK